MPSRSHSTLTLPTELWLDILRLAIRMSDWKPYMFFPPADDFALIEGFRNTSLAFRELVETAEHIFRGRSVIAYCAKDILGPGFLDESVRHLLIKRRVNKVRGDNNICEQHFTALESLSIYLHNNVVPICFQATPIAQSLRRLDLSCRFPFFCNSGDILFDSNDTLELDFPNLVELRLAVEDPVVRRAKELCPKRFLLQSDFCEAWRTSRHISILKGALIKLQCLRLLSVHMTFTHEAEVAIAFEYRCHSHHIDEYWKGNLWSECKRCRDRKLAQDDNAAKLKEGRAIKELAEVLPKLECVRWTDAWSKEYFDEVGQREYEVSRKDNGEISIIERGTIEESWPDDRYCFL